MNTSSSPIAADPVGADRWLTAPQAAEMLGLAAPTFWKNVASGWLPQPAYVAPKAPRWRLSWLNAALEAKRALPREAVAARRKAKLARLRAKEEPRPAA